MFRKTFVKRGTARRRRLKARMRSTSWTERVCDACKSLVDDRCTCPLCGGETRLATVKATGPFTGSPSPSEGSP
jgi:hypothetical protein